MELFTLVVVALALLALLVASYTDIKTREVPDFVSYGLLFIAIGVRLIFFAGTRDWHYLADGALGFIIFFGIACIMFYAGQWGGGDSKVLMGLGALFGIDIAATLRGTVFDTLAPAFLINTLLAGAGYGLCWTIFLAWKNKKPFFAELKKLRTKKMLRIRNALIVLMFLTIAGVALLKQPLERIALIIFFVSTTLLYYFWLCAKAVEKACMYKLVPPEKLTEGDWIAKNIVVAGKHICGPKDLGVSKEQIAKLIRLKKQHKIKTILIKEGIPFVPSFLIGFLMTLVWGNVMMVVV
ncbi:MAG: A24 family peptidase [Candidatus Woesearchaeota archaeon]|nr:A24 family peptidase [Candidatus Woesearchaeota archaeon]